MKKKARLVLVDDSMDLRVSLSDYLKLNGYEVLAYEDIEGVVDGVAEYDPDLVILDVMLPSGDGFSLAEKIRQVSSVPIVFLTARESENDRIRGFELGGDDYVIKPFSMKEFLLRIQALLRRSSDSDSDGSSAPGEWFLDDDVMVVDDENRILRINGEEITVTKTEWNILQMLVSREDGACSRDKIIEECFKYSYKGYARTVDTHMKNLRSKLNNPGWIETVRGYGYRFKGVRKKDSP